MKIIDFYDDIHGRILKQVGSFMPDYVANSKLSVPESVEDMPMDKFAFVTSDGDVKKLPVNTAVNTWLSSAYYVVTKNEIPAIHRPLVQEKLASARKFFDVKIDIGLVKLANETRSEVVVHWGLPKEHKFPLETSSDIGIALEKFASVYTKMSPEQRVTLSRITIQRASELGVDIDLSSPIVKYASSRLSPHFSMGMYTRKQFILDSDAKKMIEKISSAAFKAGKISNNRTRIKELDKLASVIKLFDKKNNIDHLWDVKIPDPAFTVFSQSENINDKVRDDSKFTKIACSRFANDVEKLRGCFDDQFIDNLKRDPNSISKLGDLQKGLVVSLLR